jgi:hypothetical protein
MASNSSDRGVLFPWHRSEGSVTLFCLQDRVFQAGNVTEHSISLFRARLFTDPFQLSPDSWFLPFSGEIAGIQGTYLAVLSQ